MMEVNFQHWIEVLVAAMVGLGGWLYGIGRRYQSLREANKYLGQEDSRMAGDIARLEARLNSEVVALRQEIAAVNAARSESATKIYQRLDEISREQAAQAAQIAHIAETCNRTNQSLMDMLAGRRAGGNRYNDPPLPQ